MVNLEMDGCTKTLICQKILGKNVKKHRTENQKNTKTVSRLWPPSVTLLVAGQRYIVQRSLFCFAEPTSPIAVAPKLVRAVTQIIVAIMSYYPQSVAS